MRGYGLPRNNDVEVPDKADLALYGLKGGNLRSDRKSRARRVWKKRERLLAKGEIRKDLSDE